MALPMHSDSAMAVQLGHGVRLSLSRRSPVTSALQRPLQFRRGIYSPEMIMRGFTLAAQLILHNEL